jgi:hypothetical protein
MWLQKKLSSPLADLPSADLPNSAIVAQSRWKELGIGTYRNFPLSDTFSPPQYFSPSTNKHQINIKSTYPLYYFQSPYFHLSSKTMSSDP